jgi:hypothetical protein
MLTSFARQGVRQGPPAFVSLPAVYREWESPTDDTARFSLPLPPNHGYDTDDVRVFVGGVEQAIYIEELRGRHNNGNGGDGGARAFFVECDASAFTDADPAEIQLGNGTRGTTDLSASGRGQWEMVYANFQNPRTILCTDADYLCSAQPTLHPLVSDDEKDASDIAWAVTHRDLILSNSGTSGWPNETPGADGGGNWYDLGANAFSWWAETGNPDYWWIAAQWCQRRFIYGCPSNGGVTAGSQYLNPEGFNGSGEGPAEWWSLMRREQASAYLCSGYGQFWRNVCASSTQQIATAKWFANSRVTAGGGRFNVGTRMISSVYGAAIDATYLAPMGTWAGDGNASFTGDRRSVTYRDDLPKILTDMDAEKYSAAAGAYRENFRGVAITTDPSLEIGNMPCSVGDQQAFQSVIPSNFLVDYYVLVKADFRIPGWVQTNVDSVLANLSLNGVTGLWGANYMLSRTPKRRRGDIETPFDDSDELYVWEYNSRAAAVTSTTMQLNAATKFLADDEINGQRIIIRGTTGGNQARTVTDYVASTRTVTFDTALTTVPTIGGGNEVEYLVTTTDPDDDDGLTKYGYDNVADLMRSLQFVQAVYPTHTVNGKTYTEWLNIFRAQHVTNVVDPGGSSVYQPNNGSVFGRWWDTKGCYFTRYGVTGPSEIRESVIHGDAP